MAQLSNSKDSTGDGLIQDECLRSEAGAQQGVTASHWTHDLSKQFPEDFMLSTVSFTSSSPQRDVHFSKYTLM